MAAPAWAAQDAKPSPDEADADVRTSSPDLPPAPTNPDADRHTLLQYLRHPDFQPLRSLLVDQEMPIVGVRWGAQVQFDTPIGDGSEDASPTLRQARLVFYRGFGGDLTGKVTSDYNDEGQFEIGDSYLVYTGWKSYKATLGVFRPPYGLETASKRAGLTFMERALPGNALSERRSAGVSMLKRTTRSIFDVGVYLFSPDDEGRREKGQSIVVHYAHAPLESGSGRGWLDERGIWAGVSVSYRNDAAGRTRLRSRPELNTVDDYFVDTGAIEGAGRVVRVGLDASKVDGPFSWQAEVLGANVQRDGAKDVHFFGAYAFASWFLTGESRNYDSASGRFLGVTPKQFVERGGWGAWELAVRASTVNLNDEDIVGGRQRDVSLGLNWYVDDQFRLQANLVKVLGVKRPGSEFDGQDPWMAAVRVQWVLP